MADEIIVIGSQDNKWIKNKVSIAGIRRWFAERMSAEYKAHMDTLRDVDESIRQWRTDLLQCVKDLEVSFKKGRIIDVASHLARINKRMKDMIAEGEQIEGLYEDALTDFEKEYEQADPELMRELHEQIGSTASRLLSSLNPDGTIKVSAIKNAGIKDWLSKDYWARKYIAKKLYGRKIKERNMAIRRLISSAKQAVGSVERYLKEMNRAKKDGDIGRYIDLLKQIEVAQQRFESDFVPVYNKYLRQPVEEILLKQREEPVVTQEPVPETVRMPEAQEEAPESEEEPETVPIPEMIEEAPETKREPGLQASDIIDAMKKQGQSKEEFLNYIVFMAGKLENIVGDMTDWVEAVTGSPVDLDEDEWPDTEQEEEPPETEREPLTQLEGTGDLPEYEAPPETISGEAPTIHAPPGGIEEKPIEMSSGLGTYKWPTRFSELDLILLKQSHEKFLNELAKLSVMEDTSILALAMRKYAEKIKNIDPETSLKVLAIAEGIE